MRKTMGGLRDKKCDKDGEWQEQREKKMMKKIQIQKNNGEKIMRQRNTTV